MINLYEEAKEYKEENTNKSGFEPEWNDLIPAFIGGVRSKFVKQEMLQAQIYILEQHIEHPTKPGYKRNDVLNSIKNLKQELKQFQDDDKKKKDDYKKLLLQPPPKIHHKDDYPFTLRLCPGYEGYNPTNLNREVCKHCGRVNGLH
jgi:seryl-tRNA synthetase